MPEICVKPSQARGCPCPVSRAMGASEARDGEAQRTCREQMPGGPSANVRRWGVGSSVPGWASQRSLRTTFCGLPARKARMLAAVTSKSRRRAARVAQAMCGVITQFFAVRSGLEAAGGSTESTSSPAPAIVPASSAAGEVGLVDEPAAGRCRRGRPSASSARAAPRRSSPSSRA